MQRNLYIMSEVIQYVFFVVSLVLCSQSSEKNTSFSSYKSPTCSHHNPTVISIFRVQPMGFYCVKNKIRKQGRGYFRGELYIRGKGAVVALCCNFTRRFKADFYICDLFERLDTVRRSMPFAISKYDRNNLHPLFNTYHISITNCDKLNLFTRLDKPRKYSLDNSITNSKHN